MSVEGRLLLRFEHGRVYPHAHLKLYVMDCESFRRVISPDSRQSFLDMVAAFHVK